MDQNRLKELRDSGFIESSQYESLEPIITRKVVSVFYELRIILYLGIMLFSTGAGILIYENIGDIGHLLSITTLFILTIICFYFALTRAKPYSASKVETGLPYYDYIVLLGCLLFISVLGYLQFQYELFDTGMGTVTLVTALLFFAAAYRFDHLGVLSLAITAFASFWSISISPQKWYMGDIPDADHLYKTAIFLGIGITGIGLLLDKAGIKKHFTFTWLNFGSLVYLIGSLTGVLVETGNGIYIAALMGGCALLGYYATRQKSFLFLLYAFVFGYIGISNLLAEYLLYEAGLWFFYLLASCGGFIYFIISFKSWFKR